MSSNFDFEEQREQSAIKTEIVTKYFNAWAKILSARYSKIAYIDLFAGPGIYDDGSKSTPIIIAENIVSNKNFSQKIQMCFNEKETSYFDRLKVNIGNIKDIEQLLYKPQFSNIEITYRTPNEFMISKIPCFCFLDPAGYKGLSLELIRSFGKDAGTDIIIFFNYNDINRAIDNPKVTKDMVQLFGDNRYTLLKKKLLNQNGQNRESIIINEMSESIKDVGMQYVLPFRFKAEGKNRTSHYLIFASKNRTGFIIMKDIMYKIGEKDFNGIGKFEFIPSCDKENHQQLDIVDFYNMPFEAFKLHLCKKFSGRCVKVEQLIKEDISNTRFIGKQYKEALKQLENENRITCLPKDRRKNTMGDSVDVIFP